MHPRQKVNIMDIRYKFILRNSSDLNEGRGDNRDYEGFDTLMEAVTVNRSGKYGVQGTSEDCAIVLRRYFDDEEGTRWIAPDQLLGRRRYDWNQKISYFHWYVDPMDYM